MPCSTMRNAHSCFLFGFGGLGDVQLVTFYSLTCSFLFNDLLIYLEILFFVLLLSFSMFYVIAFLFDILQLLVP